MTIQPLRPGGKPATPAIPNPVCPTMGEAKDALEKCRELRRLIRRLKWSMQRCSTCPERAECPTMRSFAQAMEGAMGEVCQEWGLDQE